MKQGKHLKGIRALNCGCVKWTLPSDGKIISFWQRVLCQKSSAVCLCFFWLNLIQCFLTQFLSLYFVLMQFFCIREVLNTLLLFYFIEEVSTMLNWMFVHVFINSIVYCSWHPLKLTLISVSVYWHFHDPGWGNSKNTQWWICILLVQSRPLITAGGYIAYLPSFLRLALFSTIHLNDKKLVSLYNSRAFMPNYYICLVITICSL